MAWSQQNLFEQHQFITAYVKAGTVHLHSRMQPHVGRRMQESTGCPLSFVMQLVKVRCASITYAIAYKRSSADADLDAEPRHSVLPPCHDLGLRSV